MFKKVALLVFSISFAGLTMQAQETYILSGTVLDEAGAPLFGASVVNRSSMRGVATNANGQFSLNLQEFPAFLEISFIGYTVHYRELNPRNFNAEGRLEISLRMQPHSQELEAATIEGRPYEEVYVHRNIAVLDFTFVGDHILLLLREGMRDYKLALIDQYQDSLSTLNLDLRADNFVTDCLGHIYVQGKDSVYGLSFANQQIHPIGAIENEWYNTMVKPCVASNPHNLYYRFWYLDKQMVEYFQTPMGEKKSRMIRRIVDYDEAFSKLDYKNTAQQLMGAGNKMSSTPHLPSFRKGFEMMGWYKNILAIPIYHPLFAQSKGALLFDHLRDSVLVLDTQGQVQQKYFIDHHKDSDFKDEILRDVATGKLYARFEKSGIVKLRPFSPDYHLENKSVIIQKFDFPQALKIRNGVAYFLDHSDEDYQKLKLYRQKL